MQVAVSILQQTVATLKEGAGKRVGMHDPATPLHAEHACQVVVEQFLERGTQCSGAGECGTDPDEMAYMGREASDQVYLIGFAGNRPARRIMSNPAG